MTKRIKTMFGAAAALAALALGGSDRRSRDQLARARRRRR